MTLVRDTRRLKITRHAIDIHFTPRFVLAPVGIGVQRQVGFDLIDGFSGLQARKNACAQFIHVDQVVFHVAFVAGTSMTRGEYLEIKR